MINYLKFELRNRKPCKQRTLVPDFDRFQTMRGDTDTDLVFLQARGRRGPAGSPTLPPTSYASLKITTAINNLRRHCVTTVDVHI